MTNIEKLDELGILGNVRESLGADDAQDTSRDDTINHLTNRDLIAQWSQWHLGSKTWWITMKSMFDELEEMDKTNG
jgi:hypothetical protein